jgi:hypothetical protein
MRQEGTKILLVPIVTPTYRAIVAGCARMVDSVIYRSMKQGVASPEKPR